jgi:hypothetical protein
MYEVEIYTVLPGIDGEVHMMTQIGIKTYEAAVEAAARVEGLGMRSVIKESEPA